MLYSGEGSMVSISESKHFRTFQDPVTKVRSYVLNTKAAGQQQSFYFVNRAMDEKGR